MHGNAWEWCGDRFAGPPAPMSWRVLRGGGWGMGPREARSGYRWIVPETVSYEFIGLRPAFSLAPGEEAKIEPYLVEE